MGSIAFQPGADEPNAPSGFHWAYDARGNPSLVKDRWKPPTPIIATRFTNAIRMISDAWRTLNNWQKTTYSGLSEVFPFGRPDRTDALKHSWRAFLSTAFTIPYFATSNAYATADTEGRTIKPNPTITINTAAQTITATVEFYAPDPPDTTDLVTLFLVNPAATRPTRKWRNTRLVAFRDTWDGADVPQDITGPTPYPFAAGQTLFLFLRHRSQQTEPHYTLYAETAP